MYKRQTRDNKLEGLITIGDIATSYMDVYDSAILSTARTPVSYTHLDVYKRQDLEIAQRIIDFISGATFAISGNLQKISNYIFLVTPTNVDISGDLQDLLSGSMEQPTVRGRF